ncbi:MAG: hypothetical protein ABGY09_03050 [Euryarchaeota archaeon]
MTLREYLVQLRECSTLCRPDREIPVMQAMLPWALTYASWIAASLLRASSTVPGLSGPTGPTALVVLIGMLAGEALYLYYLYLLIRRRNEHFERSFRFFSTLIRLLHEAGYEDVATLELEVERLRGEPRNPMLWVLLSLIPILGLLAVLYVYHSLNRDFHEHSTVERGLVKGVARAVGMSPYEPPFEVEELKPVPRRSTVLYLALTVLTLGAFTVYWWYTLIRDPNEHFRAHERFERRLIRALEEGMEG